MLYYNQIIGLVERAINYLRDCLKFAFGNGLGNGAASRQLQMSGLRVWAMNGLFCNSLCCGLNPSEIRMQPCFWNTYMGKILGKILRMGNWK